MLGMSPTLMGGRNFHELIRSTSSGSTTDDDFETVTCRVTKIYTVVMADCKIY